MSETVSLEPLDNDQRRVFVPILEFFTDNSRNGVLSEGSKNCLTKLRDYMVSLDKSYRHAVKVSQFDRAVVIQRATADAELRLSDMKIELAKTKTDLAEAHDFLRDTVRQLKVARAGLAEKNEKLAEQAERAEADGVTIDELSRQVDSLWTSHKGMRNEIVSINQRLDRLDEGLVQLLKRGNPRTQPSLN